MKLVKHHIDINIGDYFSTSSNTFNIFEHMKARILIYIVHVCNPVSSDLLIKNTVPYNQSISWVVPRPRKDER